jgi:hypothetical protein
MKTAAPWPTNRYGTSWRSVTMWFGWSDEEFIWDAIEEVGLRRITARFRPMIIVGFNGDGCLRTSDLRQIIQDGREGCLVIDPRPDLERALARITADYGDDPWINILGIGRIDVADESTFEALMDRLAGHWDWSWPDVPYIEF